MFLLSVNDVEACNLFLARRMRDAQRTRERRARLTPDQIAQQRRRDAVLKRERRAKESEAEKAIRRSLEAQKARERRAKMLCKKKGFTSICTSTASRMGLSHFVSYKTKIGKNSVFKHSHGLSNSTV
jgi:hypothetical protein